MKPHPKHPVRFSLLFLTFIFFSQPSAALIFGQDDRIIVDTRPGSVFAPIGIVYGVPEASYGTAFIIADCYALTAQHVFGSTRSAIGRQIVFASGVRGPSKTWRTTRATVVADGQLERESLGDGYGLRRSDWAILRLSKCLGRKFGHVILSSRMPEIGEEVSMAGYPVDRPVSEGLMIDPSCQAREWRAGVLLHDCATQPGNSGGPLYRVVTSNGRSSLEVFAIAVAGHSYGVPGADFRFPITAYNWYYANVASPISALAASLQSANAGKERALASASHRQQVIYNETDAQR